MKRTLKQRTVSLLLVMCVLIGFGTTASAASADDFTDIEGHWAYEDIDVVVKIGLFNGISSTTFGPDQDVSRAMFVTTLGRLYEAEGNTISNTNNSYTDVSSSAYYNKYVSWATSMGIVEGYGGGLFGPDDVVTRQQMVTMLYRYACEYSTVDPEDTNTAPLVQYQDRNLIADWALDAMAWARANYIITGVTDSTLAPLKTTSRAEASVVLRRYVSDSYRFAWYDDTFGEHDLSFRLNVSTHTEEMVYTRIKVENTSNSDYILTYTHDDGTLLLSETVAPGETGEYIVELSGGPQAGAILAISARNGGLLTGHVYVVTGVSQVFAA